MKISDKITIECDGKDDDDLFRKLAEASDAEVLGDAKCGVCGCPNVRYVVREAEGFEFFEQHCCDPKCKARLLFGKTKENGKRYPKRYDIEQSGKNKGKVKRDADGKSIYLPNKGWSKYEAPAKDA